MPRAPHSIDTLHNRCSGLWPTAVVAVVMAGVSSSALSLEESDDTGQDGRANTAEPGPFDLEIIELEPTPPTSAASAPPKQNRMIEEIVVTATKREQSLRDIPISIAAMDGQTLESTGSEGMADYLRTVPGVVMNQGFSGPDSNRVTVRGMGMETANAVTSSPTGIFVEDAAFSDPFLAYVSPDVNPFDLKAVEVLKGPQGTLFGGSALAGAVRYTMEPPNFDGFQGRVRLAYETLDQGSAGRTAAAALNVPLGSEFAVRVVALDRRAPGVIDETGRGESDIDRLHQQGGRLLAKWDISHRLDASAMFMTQHSVLDDTGFADNPDGNLTRDNTPKASPFDTRFSVSTLKLSYGLDWADLASITSAVAKNLISDQSLSRYVTGDQYTPEELIHYPLDVDSSGISQEFRLVSPGGQRWNWVTGLFAQSYRMNTQSGVFAGAADGSSTSPGLPSLPSLPGLAPEVGYFVDINAKVSELALFADTDLALGDQLTAHAGGRVYRIKTEGTTLSSYQGAEQSFDASTTETGFNPKFALTWWAANGIQIYAQAAKGFRYGGMQIVAPVPVVDDSVPRVYGSDSAWNYEVGTRTDWLDESLHADLTLFHIDWRDAQYTQPAPSGTFNYIDNIGSARSQGAELSISWLPPVDGLSLQVFTSYMDARTSSSFVAYDGSTIPSGTRLPGSSRLSSAATANYGRRLGSVAWDLSMTYAWQGQAFSDLEHRHRTLDFDTIDLAAGLSFPEFHSARLDLIVKNLTDADGLGNVFEQPDHFTDYYYIRPRTLRLQLSTQF